MKDRRYLRLTLIALLAGAGSSCTEREPDRSACEIGSQGCPCTKGRGCDPGLACTTGTCTPRSVDDEADEPGEPAPVKLELPKTDAIQLPAATKDDEPLRGTIVVSCTKDGHVYVDNRSIDDDDELARVLTEVAQVDPDLQAIVNCDADAPVARLIELIDMLRSAGIRKYAIATRPKNDEPRPTPPEVPPSR
jgi:biopolymer transport protein ExbD